MKTLSFLLLFLISVMAPMGAQGASSPKPISGSDQKLLNKAFAALSPQQGWNEIQVEKEVYSELMDRRTQTKGVLSLSKGKFRWLLQEPENSLLLFDGKVLWTEQKNGVTGEAPLVTRMKLDQAARNQILVKLLEGRGQLTARFQIRRVEINNDKDKVFDLEPRVKDPTVNNLRLVVGPKKSKILSISYTDDVGNETTLKIGDVKKNKKIDPSIFQYKPPAGSQVTEL